MYDGEYFDARQLIGEIMVNSTLRQRRLRYTTSPHSDTMGIRVTGSPAFGDYGFIAEIVTLPQSPSGRPDFGNARGFVVALLFCVYFSVGQLMTICAVVN